MKIRLAPEQRRAEILTAARMMLREHGYERFATTEVARRAGVSKALVHRYFPTKRELLEQGDRGMVRRDPHHRARPRGDGGAVERLRYAVGYSLNVIRQEPTPSRYILTELRSDPGVRPSALYALDRRFTGVVTAVWSSIEHQT